MKRFLLALALALGLPALASAACADLPNCRQCTSLGTINSTTGGNLSLGMLPTVGSTLKIFLAPYMPLSIATHASVVTDNQSGNSYAVNTSARIVAAATNNRVEIYAGVVVGSTGTFTLSWALDGSSYTGVWMVCEFTGLDSPSYDRHGTQETLGNTTIVVTATTVNSQANELVCALMYNNGGGGGASTPSGYAELFLDNTTIGAEAACKNVAVVQTSAATWNYTSGDSLAVLTTDKIHTTTIVQRRTPYSPRVGTRTVQIP